MNKDNQKICDKIKDYIYKELENNISDSVFNAMSFEELGKIYYDQILNLVDAATEELIKFVIKAISVKKSNFKNTKDYYLAICDILDFKQLPSSVLDIVENRFDEILVQKRNSIMCKYQAEIARLQNQLLQTKISTDLIKNAPKTLSFLRDISEDEKKLYELASECNQLRTRKESLLFAYQYIESKIAEFCDINDPESIKKAKRKYAIDLSTNDTIDEDKLFDIYNNSLEIFEDDVDRDYMLFFKIKLIVALEQSNEQYRLWFCSKSDDKAFELYKSLINKIPKIDDLHLWKEQEGEQYKRALDQFIINFDLFNYLFGKINSSICFRERKATLEKALELYKQGDYVIFNIIIPVQIEGMFADFLRDSTTFTRFSSMTIFESALLQEKIRLLNETSDPLYMEASEYFMFYFNNLIRNRIAHGRYKGDSDNQLNDEIFAKELMLDLCLLVHMSSRMAETEKMYRFLHGYVDYYNRFAEINKDLCYEALFNDLIGTKLILDDDRCEKYRPIQIVYWIVNPYYEKLYESVGDKNDLLRLRSKLLSNEFWEYVLKKLDGIITTGFDYLNINSEFYAVVKGLFNCQVTRETKITLGRVNSKLTMIKKM